jgi:hypothetical protein
VADYLFSRIITIPISLYRSGNGDDRTVGASDGSEKGATSISQSVIGVSQQRLVMERTNLVDLLTLIALFAQRHEVAV